LPRLAKAAASRAGHPAAERLVVRPNPPPLAPLTSSQLMLDLLRRKGFWLEAVESQPVCLGIPLGRDGPHAAVSVDVGLKHMALVSLSELVDASPDLKHRYFEHALEASAPISSAQALQRDAAMLRDAQPVPMAVIAKADMQELPIANPVHPDALELEMSEEQVNVLRDPFFKQERGRDLGLINFVVDGVPGADRVVTLRRQWQKEKQLARREANAAVSDATDRT